METAQKVEETVQSTKLEETLQRMKKQYNGQKVEDNSRNNFEYESKLQKIRFSS